MPWATPTLKEVRGLVRDNIRGSLPGADASIPNSVLRVLSDAQGGLCHLTLQYLDWLALQLLPDTAETEWLDRHGDIWLVNADGSTGRKMATFATGTVNFTGIGGAAVPMGAQLAYSDQQSFETTATVVLLADAPTPVPVIALVPGVAGNLPAGTSLGMTQPLSGVDPAAVVAYDMSGGTDQESDDDLRARVLRRIRQPPMGGSAHDYEAWALSVPGVTRAWCGGSEMGPGTVTVRFMMDDLRADNGGFPLQADCETVAAYIETVRPVSVKDVFVVAPIPQPIDVNVLNLIQDTADVRGAIEASIEEMLMAVQAPGQTIYLAWKYSAVMAAAGVQSFMLTNTTDDIMPSKGHMAVLGDLYFTTTITVPSAPLMIGAPRG